MKILVRQRNSEESNIQSFKDSLNKITNFDEMIAFAKSRYSETQNVIFPRLSDLKLMIAEEEGDLSLKSLKGVFLYLYSIKNFKKPTITVNDLGNLQLNWKKDRENLLTLYFKESDFLHYIIFKPSRYTSKHIILSGTMHILDFQDYASRLGIELHKESK